jgi:hypothetical protein
VSTFCPKQVKTYLSLINKFELFQSDKRVSAGMKEDKKILEVLYCIVFYVLQYYIRLEVCSMSGIKKVPTQRVESGAREEAHCSVKPTWSIQPGGFHHVHAQ